MAIASIASASVVLASLLLYNLISLYRHLRAAKQTSLPYVISPIHELSNWAFLTNTVLRWIYTSSLLRDDGWPKWARYMIKDWMYEDKGRAHRELGDVFLVVTPGGLMCYTADANMTMSILTRRREFPKPREKMEMLEPYGPNIVSTEGNDWRVHFRVTAPSVGDKVNDLVWKETLRQTGFLVNVWSRKGSGKTRKDVSLVALNVMACAGFGRRFEWTEQNGGIIPPGHTMSLLTTIVELVKCLGVVLLLPKWLIKRSPWKLAYTAYTELEQYAHELIREEKELLKKDQTYGGKIEGNLLTAMLKTNESEMKGKKDVEAGMRAWLTDSEVLGNVFMYFMAGYDTTASTMMFGAVLLAIHENLQEELIKEVDQAFEEAFAAGRKDLDYANDFPKLRLALSFMYESLRVFPTVVPIAKMITENQQIHLEDSQTHILPAGCRIIINNTAIHHHPRYWQEPSKFDPYRWLTDAPNKYDPKAPDAAENKRKRAERSQWQPSHIRGTFLTFADGPRSCIGKRFAHVEYVAFLVGLVRNHRVKLGRGGNKEDVEKVLRLQSAGSLIVLASKDDVELYLEPR